MLEVPEGLWFCPECESQPLLLQMRLAAHQNTTTGGDAQQEQQNSPKVRCWQQLGRLETNFTVTDKNDCIFTVPETSHTQWWRFLQTIDISTQTKIVENVSWMLC
jgi:hypothetical protein